ncbi:MAG: Uma2 family endonuclease [Firmicutes bacterium]|nr:Uma2 family endonuclease [Bacillota bacterium]
MAVQAVSKPITYEEWLRMPETNQRYEIVDGVLQMSPAPNMLHQLLVGELSGIFRKLVPKSVGLVVTAPIDVTVSRSPLKVRQPDVMVVLFREDGWRDVQALLDAPPGEVIPDLVVVVLSPSESRVAVQEKIEDYQRAGVREAWIVSPEAQTVEVLRLSAQKTERIGLYGRGDTVRSELLPELQVDTDRLFA